MKYSILQINRVIRDVEAGKVFSEKDLPLLEAVKTRVDSHCAPDESALIRRCISDVKERGGQLIDGDTVMMTAAELSAILGKQLPTRRQCIDTLNRDGYSPLWEQMSTADLIFCTGALAGETRTVRNGLREPLQSRRLYNVVAS